MRILKANALALSVRCVALLSISAMAELPQSS
jgi:hypothetical protein